MKKQVMVILFGAVVCYGAEQRVWTGRDGKTLQAQLITVIGDQLVLRTAGGRQLKVPRSAVSVGDQRYVDLNDPPEFTITFTKQSTQRFLETGPYIERNETRIFDYTFGVKLRQVSARPYPYELSVEFFSIGSEAKTYGDKYILLQRMENRFVPSADNRRSHSFSGRPVELMQFIFDSDTRGEKYAGFVVTVTDLRGQVIASSASSDWLLEHLAELKKMPVGSYFDKTGTRTFPTRPRRTRY